MIQVENLVNEPSESYAGRYSYADYLLWTIDERFELYKGKLFKMSPGPNRAHQKASRLLTRAFYESFPENNRCEVYIAPFDVRLLDKQKSTDDKDIYTVVQPDLCVICDASKLDKRGCIGAPDLIVEILSPGNTKKEMDLKFDIYEENGVREYWMVNLADNTVLRYILENERFIGLKPVTDDDIVESHVFPNLKFNAKDIF